MSRIVHLQTVRRTGTQPARTGGVEVNSTNAPPDCYGRLLAMRQEVFRSILLIDLAAQQAGVLSAQISDPTQREQWEAQLANIERLIKLARKMAQAL